MAKTRTSPPHLEVPCLWGWLSFSELEGRLLAAAARDGRSSVGPVYQQEVTPGAAISDLEHKERGVLIFGCPGARKDVA